MVSAMTSLTQVNISETMGDSRLFPTVSLLESGQVESNSHFTDDVT